MADDGVASEPGGVGAGAATRYAHVPYPWQAAIDLRSPQPARFYADLVTQALHHGLPARRRPRVVWSRAARHGLPGPLAARAARLFPRRPKPELDALRRSLGEHWGGLARTSSRLPSAPPELALLAVEKRAALTVFAFGDCGRPLLVAKLPQGADGRVDLEVRALEEAAPAAIAPRFLGRVGRARVQEALDGGPIELWPLTPRGAGGLAWPPMLAELVRAFTTLAEHTAGPGEPDGLREPIELALDGGLLGGRTEAVVRAALRDVSRLERSVLEHRDGSSHNCLFVGDRLSGLVDWEIARLRGVPGFDVWNTTLAWMEYGLGLVRWSQEVVLECFERAWPRSPFWESARAGARESARAAGVPEPLLDPLEVAFFARRVGHRIQFPDRYRTDAGTAVRMLDVVCAA